MNKPAVSIIVTVYNVEIYLRRCLDSILAQTFADWECILVDDGSLDSSGAICDEYVATDERFVVFHKDNGGVSNARQFGLDRAQGDYVIHADPDDWVENDMLQTLYEEATNNDIDMLICDYFKEYSTRREYIIQKPTSYDHETVLSDLFYGLFGSCWNKLIKKSTVIKYDVHFPENWGLCEDHYFMASFLTNDIKVGYINKAFYHYVVTENPYSITSNIYQKYDYYYDTMLYQSFTRLTYGHLCERRVRSVYAFIIISNEFSRHSSTSYQFSKKCVRYLFEMFGYSCPLRVKFLYCISCLGGYSVSYKLHRYINRNKFI